MSRKIQFSASHLPVEDRLILRGVFSDGVEFRLLLTRRLTRGFLALVDEAARRVVPDTVAGPETKRRIAEFKQEAAVESADYSQSFEDGEVHPLMADGPRLATDVALTQKSADLVTIRFKLDNDKALQASVPHEALWALAHMIEQQAGRANWNLPQRAEAGPTQDPSGQRPH